MIIRLVSPNKVLRFTKVQVSESAVPLDYLSLCSSNAGAANVDRHLVKKNNLNRRQIQLV